MSSAHLETCLIPVQRISALDEFGLIRDEAMDAVLWSRTVPETVQAWLDGLSVNALPQGRFVLKAADTNRCVLQLFEKLGYAIKPELIWLAEDIAALAHHLSKTLASPDIRMRIEVVTDDACRKFHVDNVLARMICTYSGPGTEYGVSGKNKAPEQIHRVPTGQPMLFKGKLWPGARNRVLQHRSPPVAGMDIARFVIVLEAAASTDYEAHSPYDTRFP